MGKKRALSGAIIFITLMGIVSLFSDIYNPDGNRKSVFGHDS